MSFISRGCTDVTYVDKFPGCVAFVKKTSKLLDIESNIKIVKGDVFKFIQYSIEQYDYIFAGPPYPLPNIPEIPDRIFEKNMVKPDGWLVLEHNPAHDFKTHPNFYQERNYSKTLFSIFQPEQ